MELPQAAQVCLKGHLINEVSEWDPSSNRKFCPTCGSPTVLACSGCESKIVSSDSNPYKQFMIPSFCSNCGLPFPWTERTLQAVSEFADELDILTVEEKAQLKATVPDLISDTPRTPLAVSRIQKAFTKIGKPAAQGLMQILVSVLTEEAKKQIGLS